MVKYKYGEVERVRIQGKSVAVGGHVIEVSFLVLGKESTEWKGLLKMGCVFGLGSWMKLAVGLIIGWVCQFLV